MTPERYCIREVAVDDEQLRPLIDLHHECLPSRQYATPEQKAGLLAEVRAGLAGRESLVLATFDAERVVAYKIAYRTGNRHEILYSWLGGVHPHHRRKGLARALIRAQHAWAHEHGITHVETHTWGDNPGMLILNLHEGFSIVGVTSGPDRPGVRVILRKALSAPVLPR
ncbi:MAG: GNAT family N-acetyltransferase [Planctomycetes bacterium]|nr:GNAT family N-acetyltransferase [Planctomycetota bacterium]